MNIKPVTRPRQHPTLRLVQIDDSECHLIDGDTGDIVARTITCSNFPGKWIASLHKDFAARSLNPVTCIADDPESALSGVIEENIKLTQDILQQLIDALYGINHEPGEEFVVEVPVEVIEQCHAA